MRLGKLEDGGWPGSRDPTPELRHRAGIPFPSLTHTYAPSLQIRKLSTQITRKEEMSRRTAAIVEEFDDDTDLPLPNQALPNTGTRGAILEEIGIDPDREVDEDSGDEDYDLDLRELSNAQPSATGSAPRQEGSNSRDPTTITDIKPYKS